MASYLLLRDNKESGPFTLGELQNFGLKPYDLIWIQGKSAAWRYPSEIEELKPFAPAIEEQPFDRFFKKNTAEEKREELPVIEPQYSKYIPQESKQAPTYTSKRSVFVTLPGNKQVALKQDPQPIQQKPASEPLSTPTISITENPAAAEIKYSQPLDEIKEMYVKTLLERKDKKVRKGLMLAIFKKAAVFGGLVVLGVLAGFIIRSKHGSNGNSEVVPDLMQVSASIANKPGNSALPAETSEPVPDRIEESGVKYSEPARKNTASDPVEEEPAQYEEEPPKLTIRKETMMIVPKRKESYASQPNPGATIDPLTGERERKLRNVNEVPERTPTTHSLKDLVSVTSNDYKRVAFGGIRNLYLTVTNRSKFELDHVVVELQYLKPSEEPLRTENINFESIAPSASSTIRIPDTNRGIKVNYRIINIRSRHNPDLAAGQ